MNRTAVRSSLLAVASLGLGAIFACALPFVALATAAARSLPARFAYGVVALTWLVDQTLGFTVRHYPHDAATLGWGVVIGVAAIAATMAARRAPTLTIGFVLAFVVDQGVLAAYAALLHDMNGFSAAIVGQMALVDAACLAILAPLAFAPTVVSRIRGARSGAARR